MAELDDLIDGWIDGTLGATDQRRLESLLDRDPASRSRFHQRLQVEGLLRQQVRHSQATASAAPAATRLPRLFAAGLSAAALLALAFLLPLADASTNRSGASPVLAKPSSPTDSPVGGPARTDARTITVLVRQGQTTISQHRETISASHDFTLKLLP